MCRNFDGKFKIVHFIDMKCNGQPKVIKSKYTMNVEWCWCVLTQCNIVRFLLIILSIYILLISYWMIHPISI